MSTPASTPPTHPRRSALRNDADGDRTSPSSASSSKAVQIAEPEVPPLEESQVKKQFTAGMGRRLSGRPPLMSASRMVTGGHGITSSDSPGSFVTTASPSTGPDDPQQPQQSHHRHRLDRVSEKLLAQVADWLQHEKAKKMNRKVQSVLRKKSSRPENGDGSVVRAARPRAPSADSETSDVSFDRLQRILDDGMAAMGLNSIPHFSPRLGRKSGRRPGSHHHHKNSTGLARTASSDTEYVDGDVVVPACDAVLDNSKTMSYTCGKASGDTPSGASRREEKEKQAWLAFKNEVIRIAHTLRLKGWRHVPLDAGDTISVERLSGALTNAVYVVSPPAAQHLRKGSAPSLGPATTGAATTPGKRLPTKVLLRVYGPQVEQLIDRDNELSVLRRLARNKIGPRLLGTFVNGRFEQFFNATALTPAHMREPETSRQIAKRMRELHDGIELLADERAAGPVVWKNWDRWLEQVERATMFLDDQVRAGAAVTPTSSGLSSSSPSGRLSVPSNGRGFICGVEWPVFRAVVEKYRRFLKEYYGGPKNICEKLVFAHNDTQYGNILRVRPDDERSPLLQPENEHKQLIVIDFEYAGANMPSLEFANHFTEWTYDYHDRAAPYACNTSRYPTPEQQRRFVRAYVDHRPQFVRTPSAESPGYFTPSMTATSLETPPLGTPALQGAGTSSAASSIVDFMLDARVVPPGGWKEEEARREEEAERRVQELLKETRLWRVANSAQWVAWGIVQAKIPGLGRAGPKEARQEGDGDGGPVLPVGDVAENGAGGRAAAVPTLEEEEPEEREEEGEKDEFDYLSYARERALFFWGDCVLMGLVREEELPAALRASLKLVPY